MPDGKNRTPQNTELTELHLIDDMVALLKSGRISNRLLCELALYKDFIKLLADMEIYVDGIASMQMQNFNAYVDTVRHEVLERYCLGESAPYLHILSATHLHEGEYFSQLISDDLSHILPDIRTAHKRTVKVHLSIQLRKNSGRVLRKR